MNYKKARAWQDILLFGGAFVAGVGVWGFDSTFLGLLGLAMVLLSILVWWLYYRCPQCHESLGRGNPKHCPHCGAWLGYLVTIAKASRKKEIDSSRNEDNFTST